MNVRKPGSSFIGSANFSMVFLLPFFIILHTMKIRVRIINRLIGIYQNAKYHVKSRSQSCFNFTQICIVQQLILLFRNIDNMKFQLAILFVVGIIQAAVVRPATGNPTQVQSDILKKINIVFQQFVRKHTNETPTSADNSSSKATTPKFLVLPNNTKNATTTSAALTIPKSLLQTILQGRANYRSYQMQRDDVVDTIGLQIDNTLTLEALKFFLNSAYYKNRSNFYLKANLQLFDSLPNNREEEKAQNIYVVEIGILENTMGLLGSLNQGVRLMLQLEENSQTIEQELELNRLRGQLVEQLNHTRVCVLNSRLSFQNLLSPAFRRNNGKFLQALKNLEQSLVPVQLYLDKSLNNEAKVAKELFSLKQQSNNQVSSLSRQVLNLSQKYLQNEKDMYFVLKEYVSKMGDYQQLSNAFKGLNRMHSKLTSSDRLIGEREAKIIVGLSNTNTTVNKAYQLSDRFLQFNRSLLNKSHHNTEIYGKMLLTMRSVVPIAHPLTLQFNDCSRILNSLNTTITTMEGIILKRRLDTRADGTRAFLAQSDRYLSQLKSYIPGLNSRHRMFEGDFTSPTAIQFVDLLQKNYTKLAKQFPVKLSEFTMAFRAVGGRLDSEISVLKDRYNLMTMRTYRLYVQQFAKRVDALQET